jgi:hypothetical protein
MLPTFSVTGNGADAAGTTPPAGVPQDEQNFAPSSIFVPQFEQNAIVMLLLRGFSRSFIFKTWQTPRLPCLPLTCLSNKTHRVGNGA